MNGEELTEKTERLTKMLAVENLGGVLINSQPNFAWLACGAHNGIDRSRENGAASLLVRRDGKRFLLANCIEMPRFLAEEVSEKDFEPVEYSWEDEKSSPHFLAKLAADLLVNNYSLGADLPLGTKVVESSIARCRYQLTDGEIERFRQLGKDAGEIVGEAAKSLVPGQTESEIAAMVVHALAKKNIQAIVALVAADERLQKFRHPVPTEKRWEKSVMIVVCVRRGGLTASLTRIVCAGNVPDVLKQKTQACARVNAKILAATKPGATGAELYKTAAAAYDAEGFAGEINKHHQGGAAGYRTRDWVAHPASEDAVQLRQAFAWNPSVAGTKTEETCIVFGDEIEVMTASPDWAHITVEINGREYSSPDVLPI